MKRTTTSSVLIALVMMSVTAMPQTASGQSKDERAVRAQSDAWQRYIASQQIDSIVSIHTSDAVVFFGNTPPWKGSVAIRTGWGEVVKLPGLNMHWTPTRIDVASPTRATEYGNYTDSYDTPSGKASDAGSYITHWRKVNGRWKVALDAAVSAQPLPAAAPAEGTDFVARNANTIAWADFAPPGFAPGAKISVLSGDPSKAGRFVLRLSFPADYLVPLHWHPTAENVTVLSGQVHLGMGNSVDMSATQSYGPGDYAFIPARHAHFVHAPVPTIVQVSGNGPFQLNLGAPK